METRSLSPTGAAHAGQSGQSETGPSARGGKYHMTQGLVAQPPVKPVTQPSGNCWDVRRSNTRRLAIPVQRETPRGRVPKLAPAPWPRLKIKRRKNAAGDGSQTKMCARRQQKQWRLGCQRWKRRWRRSEPQTVAVGISFVLEVLLLPKQQTKLWRQKNARQTLITRTPMRRRSPEPKTSARAR